MQGAGAGSAGSSLHNSIYFPSFEALPMLDETDGGGYYIETPQGMMQPARTWCFVGEIVNDSLSQMAVLGHRVEVRDATGAVKSIMFYPASGWLDFSQLRVGHTVFVRYATRCFFSDLATEAIKVEDLNYVKIIPLSLDILMYISQAFFEQRRLCCTCHQDLSVKGGAVFTCSSCQAATYCSPDCRAANAEPHVTFCRACAELMEVYNVDFERFIQHVPFRV